MSKVRALMGPALGAAFAVVLLYSWGLVSVAVGN